jgi:Ca2+-binding EF-hand superfamily protein
MKATHYLLITLITTALAQAQEKKWSWFDALDWDKNGAVSKQEWINWNKQEAEKKGWTFNEERTVAKFTEKDTNTNGNLSREELEGQAKAAESSAP